MERMERAGKRPRRRKRTTGSESETALDFLRSLIACPSVNPASTAGNDAWYGEGRVLDLLERLLGSWGARVVRQKVQHTKVRRDRHGRDRYRDDDHQLDQHGRDGQPSPDRENLIATFLGRDESRSLCLEAHSDTVGVDVGEAALLCPRVKNGRLHGRGACDTKGPMAAMLFGIREVLLVDGRPPVTVHFVSTCDEEAGALGARQLLASGFRANACVVAEPTGLAVVHSHKGTVRFRVTTRGRAAHSSAPERGANAIRLMAPLVTAIETRLVRRLASRVHPVLGPPTVSVGTIRGGSQVNVVPERCEIEVDRRLVPGETAAMALRELRQVLASVQPTGNRRCFTIETTQEYPVLEGTGDSAIARLAAGACRGVLRRARLDAVPYATNAGFFARAGVPCVVLGPGSIRQAHTANECIDLAEFHAAIRVYAEVIRGMGRVPMSAGSP